MAAPLGMRLFSPFQIWLSFTAALTMMLIAGAGSIWRLAETENQRLTDLEADVLVRARISDFEHGNLRAVVEGLGPEFNDLYVEVQGATGPLPNGSSAKTSFHVGARTPAEKCSMRVVPTGTPGRESTFTLCRPYRAPTKPIVAVTLIFLIAATLALLLVRSLERSTVATLVGFIQSQGVSVTPGVGLAGIMRQIKAIVTQLDEARQRERQADQARFLAEIATSVAHDIKAPLAAFDRLLRGVDAIPDRYRRLATLAMGRIREIAEDLTASATAPDHTRQADRTQQIALSPLVDDVVSEARLSHSGQTGLVFLYAPRLDASQVQVAVEPQLFRRMLSNLLNNAAQAIDDAGTVAVHITSDERWVTLSIIDDGKGIAAEILPKLATRGYSIGKPGGQGLGLYHAKTSVESWGGSLAITSTLGAGTTVAVTLLAYQPGPPPPPGWP